MSSHDWKWKIGEAIERLRSRYSFIGRKTGAPFLALVYPSDLETAVLKEWHTQCDALRPEIDVRTVDVLAITQNVIADIGASEIVHALENPMPGSDTQTELGYRWVTAVAEAVQSRAAEPGSGKPVISLERLAALYPAVGPRDVMQQLWDNGQSSLDGPVVVMIPGRVVGTRTFSFVGRRDEFMYRGDLI